MTAAPGDVIPISPPNPVHSKIAVERAPFRQDINALRAVAAMVVVLFHFNVGGFAGGFVGVDIFFVISGLLMTQIIDRGIERGDFSILRFYAARARRIIPALSVLCMALVVAGCALIDPLALGKLARNALASMLFISNMLYAGEAGYFAADAENNWLLHTWTLSAEWQFYMLYPVTLVIAARWRWLWDHRVPALAVACVLLFVATVVIAGRSAHFRDISFFILPTRAWEMAAGGVLALAPRIERRHALAVLVVGSVLLALAIFGFNDAVPWPSAWTAVPVLGTIGVLAAGSHAEFAQAPWARLSMAQWLGLRSYSLYLWHWPIYVALNYYGVAISPIVMVAGVALSLLLADLSYRYVEIGLRDVLFGKSKRTSTARFSLLALVATGCLVIGGGVWITDGVERWRVARLSTEAQAQLLDYRLAENDWLGLEPCHDVKRFVTSKICILNPAATKRIAVVGDSHAAQLIPRYKALAERNHLGIDVYVNTSCPPLTGIIWTKIGEKCANFSENVFIKIRKIHYQKVLVQSAWALYFGSADGKWERGAICTPGWLGCRPEYDEAVVAERLDRAFGRLAAELASLTRSGTEVGLILPEPMNFGITPSDYYAETFFHGGQPANDYFDEQRFLTRTAMVRTRLDVLAKAVHAVLIDPIEPLCRAGHPCRMRIGGKYLFMDTHHARASLVQSDQFDYVDAFVIK